MRTIYALGGAAVLVAGVLGWLALSRARAEANPQPAAEERPVETPVPASELPPPTPPAAADAAAPALPGPPAPPAPPSPSNAKPAPATLPDPTPPAPEPKPKPKPKPKPAGVAPDAKAPAPAVAPKPPAPPDAKLPDPTPEPKPTPPAADAKPAAAPEPMPVPTPPLPGLTPPAGPGTLPAPEPGPTKSETPAAPTPAGPPAPAPAPPSQPTATPTPAAPPTPAPLPGMASGPAPAPATPTTPPVPSRPGQPEWPSPFPLPPAAGPVTPRTVSAPGPLPAPEHPSRFSANYVSGTNEERPDRAPGAMEMNSLRRQEPAVVLEWVGPPVARVGQAGEYAVQVRNTCPIPVQQVLVRVRIPAGMSIVGTEPKGLCESNVVVWELGTLAPKEEKNLQLRLVPLSRGDLLPQAWVTFTGSALMHVQVREPQLLLTASAPEKLQVGDAVTFVLTVSNPGDGPAEQVKVHAGLSDGLEHAGGSRVDFELGNLAAGESRNVQLICAARAGGEQKCLAWAEAEGGLKIQAQARLTVSMPRLDLQVLGPGVRYLDRKAVYTFKVTNPGDAPANNVVVGDVVPEGFKFVTATEGGRHDPATHAVSWFLGDIGPGQGREVKLEVLAATPGEHKHHAMVQAARGLKVEGEVLTRVECLSELALEVTPTEDPVEVGEETTYDVKVSNVGSKTETAVRLVCTLPEQMEFKGAQAPASHRVEGKTVVFEPLPQLTPKTDVVYHVHVKALKAGDVRFKAQASSTNLVEPLLETRPTRIYADTPAPGAK